MTTPVFVDFNRTTGRPNTYATWSKAFTGTPQVGDSVRMGDLEDLDLPGHISWISHDGETVHVTTGRES